MRGLCKEAIYTLVLLWVDHEAYLTLGDLLSYHHKQVLQGLPALRNRFSKLRGHSCASERRPTLLDTGQNPSRRSISANNPRPSNTETPRA